MRSQQLKSPWSHRRSSTFGLLLAFSAGAAAAGENTTFSPEDLDFFESRVRPILAERCFSCHGEGEEIEGSLRLTSRSGVMSGGDTGPAAASGDPATSLLVEAISYRSELQMPPEGKLSDAEIDALTQWVVRGLPWPPEADQPAVEPAAGEGFKITDEHRKFWAFQPLAHVEPPAIASASWAAGTIDRFILAKLEAAGLEPAEPADRRTLIRRATFDLTGLPPTAEAIDAFVNDPSPEAYAKVVDRLLASPQYGERWGRHWLDLVRYTDSFDSRLDDRVIPYDCHAAWRYRDWVVDAFNRDLPYDQFVVNQIAGDSLPAENGVSLNVPGTIATGMLAIGHWGGGDADKEKLLTDIADDQVDVTCRAFLGLTVACARCHDHKFDPIATADYYGLAGIFMSTHILSDAGPKGGSPLMLRVPLETNETQRLKAEYDAKVASVTAELESLRKNEFAKMATRLVGDVERYLLAAWDYAHWNGEAPRPPVEAFAAERGLEGFAVRGWVEALEVNQGSLLSTRVENLFNRPGLIEWRGAGDTPSLIANSTAEPISFLSILMPPRSVAIHPSPAAGVAVQWRAPQAGTFRVTGYVHDGDGACGNGVDWAVNVRKGGAESQVAGGAIDNGGRQEFGVANATGPNPITELALAANDSVSVAVLNRGDHSCDTTVVELTITEVASGRVWNLAQDVLTDPLEGGRGNPHRDAYGSPAVWRFLDPAGQRSAPLVGHALLRAWYEVAVQDDRSNGAKEEAAQAARAVQEAVDRGVQSPIPPESDPAASVYAFLISPESPFWGDDAGLPTATQAELARRSSELTSLQASPPPDPGYAHGCAEGGCPLSPQEGIHDSRIHIRGRYDRLGPIVPRRFPEVLAGADQPPINEGSGRRQLAEWIARPEHPLTARVMVNRIWQHHFGEGLVRTPSNFGKLGEPPTHPELLDYLADEFIESGWSIKAMHRQIMLSATYQLSSQASAAALEKDGDNRLLSRMNRHRLDAEQLRDSLLVAAGQLDPTRGGESTRDVNSPRRTLYLMTSRSDRTTFRDLFDGADSTAVVDKRIVSTVAPQALFMLNSPFVLKQAELLAMRVTSAAPDDDARIDQLYRWLFGRTPDQTERDVAKSLLTHWRAGGDAAAEAKAWQQYCQTLVCSNEFAFVD